MLGSPRYVHVDRPRMIASTPYPIGTPLQPWGPAEKQQWRARQVRQRSYADDVVTRIDRLRDLFDVIQYGQLDYTEGTFPLFAIKSRGWNDALPTILVTGGVHGYETSGVHGALRAAVCRPAGRALRRPCQPAGGALRQPLGV